MHTALYVGVLVYFPGLLFLAMYILSGIFRR